VAFSPKGERVFSVSDAVGKEDRKLE